MPIFKGGEPKNKANYRGITLNNILANIYSQILFNRLSEWNKKNIKNNDSQFGYQKGKSTVDCVFIFIQLYQNFCIQDKMFLVFSFITKNVFIKLIVVSYGKN